MQNDMVPRPRNGENQMKCSVNGCDRKHYAKGYCRAHWMRNRRYGSAESGATMQGDPAKAVVAAASSETDKCINWPFATYGNGYGMIWRNGRHIPATHAVMDACGIKRPTPDHQIAHEPINCHNPSCINPRHIRWALLSENMADKLLDGTDNRGARHPQAKITEADVIAIRADQRLQREIAEHFQIDQGHISAIRARKSWKHV